MQFSRSTHQQLLAQKKYAPGQNSNPFQNLQGSASPFQPHVQTGNFMKGQQGAHQGLFGPADPAPLTPNVASGLKLNVPSFAFAPQANTTPVRQAPVGLQKDPNSIQNQIMALNQNSQMKTNNTHNIFQADPTPNNLTNFNFQPPTPINQEMSQNINTPTYQQNSQALLSNNFNNGKFQGYIPPQFHEGDNKYPLKDVDLAIPYNNEDYTIKMLLLGPVANRQWTDSWCLLLFGMNLISLLVISIFGFITCDPFQYDSSKYTLSSTISATSFFKGIPSIGIGLMTSFFFGIVFQIFLMRFTFCFTLVILGLGLAALLTFSILAFIYTQIVAGIIFSCSFLVMTCFTYGIYQKLHALDQVAKMAYQFSVEMAGQYYLIFFFLFILILESTLLFFGYLFLSSKLTIDGSTIVLDPTYKYLSIVFVINCIALLSTTLLLYKFCVSYMCCQWYFGRANSAGVFQCLSIGFRHLGSLSLITLISLLIYYIVEYIKSVERFFKRVYLICISSAICTCRRSIEILISSLTVVRIAHYGSDFYSSSKAMLKQLMADPFYFLFVMWGGDLISWFLGAVSFMTGMGLGIYMLIVFNLSFDFTFIVLIIILWICCAKTSELFEQNFQIILYSIGAYYNLCDTLHNKNSSEMKNEKYGQMREKIATASSTTNFEVKDLK